MWLCGRVGCGSSCLLGESADHILHSLTRMLVEFESKQQSLEALEKRLWDRYQKEAETTIKALSWLLHHFCSPRNYYSSTDAMKDAFFISRVLAPFHQNAPSRRRSRSVDVLSEDEEGSRPAAFSKKQPSPSNGQKSQQSSKKRSSFSVSRSPERIIFKADGTGRFKPLSKAFPTAFDLPRSRGTMNEQGATPDEDDVGNLLQSFLFSVNCDFSSTKSRLFDMNGEKEIISFLYRGASAFGRKIVQLPDSLRAAWKQIMLDHPAGAQQKYQLSIGMIWESICFCVRVVRRVVSFRPPSLSISADHHEKVFEQFQGRIGNEVRTAFINSAHPANLLNASGGYGAEKTSKTLFGLMQTFLRFRLIEQLHETVRLEHTTQGSLVARANHLAYDEYVAIRKRLLDDSKSMTEEYRKKITANVCFVANEVDQHVDELRRLAAEHYAAQLILWNERQWLLEAQLQNKTTHQQNASSAASSISPVQRPTVDTGSLENFVNLFKRRWKGHLCQRQQERQEQACNLLREKPSFQAGGSSAVQILKTIEDLCDKWWIFCDNRYKNLDKNIWSGGACAAKQDVRAYVSYGTAWEFPRPACKDGPADAVMNGTSAGGGSSAGKGLWDDEEEDLPSCPEPQPDSVEADCLFFTGPQESLFFHLDGILFVDRTFSKSSGVEKPRHHLAWSAIEDNKFVADDSSGELERHLPDGLLLEDGVPHSVGDCFRFLVVLLRVIFRHIHRSISFVYTVGLDR